MHGCRRRECEEGPVPVEDKLLSLPTAKAAKAVAELCAHRVVKDGVDGGIDVGHDAAEVQRVVVRFRVIFQQFASVREHRQERQEAEGKKTQEKDKDDGAQPAGIKLLLNCLKIK